MGRQYTPLEIYTGLFREFIETPMTEDGILSFTNQYGLLGVPKMLNVFSPGDQNRLVGVWGETLTDWVRHIDELQRAVQIWDMIRAGDVAGLSTHIKWQEEQSSESETIRVAGWIYDDHPELPNPFIDPVLGVPFPAGRHRELIQEPVPRLFKKSDVKTPGLVLVQKWVNNHLKGQVSPQLLYHLDLGKEVLRIVPSSLIGALWLQWLKQSTKTRTIGAAGNATGGLRFLRTRVAPVVSSARTLVRAGISANASDGRPDCRQFICAAAYINMHPPRPVEFPVQSSCRAPRSEVGGSTTSRLPAFCTSCQVATRSFRRFARPSGRRLSVS
jgi:hypothetical protein